MVSIKLSMLDLLLYTEEIINYCLDNSIDTVVNDIGGELPFVEYELDDLLIVWDKLRGVSYEITLEKIKLKNGK